MTKLAHGSLLTLLLVASCKTPGTSGQLKSEEPVAATPAVTDGTTLIGLVPSRYLGGGKGLELAALVLDKGVIKSVEKIADGDVEARRAAGAVVLKRAGSERFDVVYPGMINLHNHTKQDVLPVWGAAKGQFANRFEWRDWDDYTKAVSFNMNPWIDHPVTTCAAFRWAELQATVLGTTYLQGPSDCVANFSVHQVEDGASYLADSDAARLANVQAPTDLVVPEDMSFVWKHLRPMVASGMSYEEALLKKVQEICPKLVAQFGIKDVMGKAELDVFKDKAKVTAGCDANPDKFQRFLNWQHKTVAGKRRYLSDPKRAAVIVHLAEGRRKDPYNTIEFEMLKLFGLDQARVNLVHGVGVDAEGFKHMAAKGMGLIWSPFSNFLLYGETLEVEAAVKAGVDVSIGSDWTPTGSKGVLEELKIARAYAKQAGIEGVITDEVLYKMATENPARMLGHEESSPADGRHGIGKIVPDAAASFVVMSARDDDAYANFVTGETKDVELVMVDGRAVYGELEYLAILAPNADVEKLPAHLATSDGLVALGASLPQVDPEADDQTKTQQLAVLLKDERVAGLPKSTACGFEKGFVTRASGEPLVSTFKAASGLDLDRPSGIQAVLAANLLTQSFNHKPNPAKQKGDAKFAVRKFPALFSCDDPDYSARFSAFVEEEIGANRDGRKARRNDAAKPLPKTAKKLSADYGLPYDAATDY